MEKVMPKLGAKTVISGDLSTEASRSEIYNICTSIKQIQIENQPTVKTSDK